MTSYDICFQKFEKEPLGIRDLTLWKRCPVGLMVEMLQDPDYADRMDWSGASPSPAAQYTSVTSGTWYKDIKVMWNLLTSYDVSLCHTISHRIILKRKAKMSSFVLLSWDLTRHTSRSRAPRRPIMCTLRPAWCTLIIVKKWMVRHCVMAYDIMWYHMTRSWSGAFGRSMTSYDITWHHQT